MKYLDEYRDPQRVARLAQRLADLVTRPWVIMEVCGGQTHNIVRFGIDRMLPEGLELIHGPGCPVCVTPSEKIDQACSLATGGVTLCTFGDMLRVPGGSTDLQSVRSLGGDVRIVYSPSDAVEIARTNRERQVVLFAVGFETTVPAVAAAVRLAVQHDLDNFSLLSSHVRVPPALHHLVSDPDCRIQGFLAAGHVCTVMGTREYEGVVRDHHVPVVVTGFEPVELLHGLLACVEQLESGVARLDNAFSRLVRADGNPAARALLASVFETADVVWRGFGKVPKGGLVLKKELQHLDALARFGIGKTPPPGSETVCRAGEVLRGQLKPDGCPAFGRTCTPLQPLGAPMVSTEGACAAYYRYRMPA